MASWLRKVLIYALDLVHDLGMDDDLISPKTNRFLILKDGKLYHTPKGLNMMVPTDPEAFLGSNFFSWSGKHRILEESVIPANTSDEDESFASFIVRRFGQEMLDLYAGPLFTGIYATPADQLSLNATFPMLKKMEQNYGSITRAIKKQMQAQPASANGSDRTTFMGLKNGIQSLSEALIKQLKHTQIKNNAFIEEILYDNDLYELIIKGEERYQTKNLIVTLPSDKSGILLKNFAPDISDILSGFSTSSSRIVTLAYPRDKVADPLLATGYVSAATEKNFVNAGTWITSKWDGRAKNGYVMLRCFIGKNPKAFTFTNDELIHTAHLEMKSLLGISGEPEFYWVQRWDNALPQYKVGHPSKISALYKAIEPFEGLHLAGSYFNGVGLPDCIKQGIDVAEIVDKRLVKILN
jgi:protoporphyrinogen/coproporphyrinogen III oxidase